MHWAPPDPMWPPPTPTFTDSLTSPSPQVYYYNTLTEASSWSQPEGFSTPALDVEEEPVPESSSRVTGTAWALVKCTDGRIYYYNEEQEVRRGGSVGTVCWGGA